MGVPCEDPVPAEPEVCQVDSKPSPRAISERFLSWDRTPASPMANCSTGFTLAAVTRPSSRSRCSWNVTAPWFGASAAEFWETPAPPTMPSRPLSWSWRARPRTCAIARHWPHGSTAWPCGWRFAARDSEARRRKHEQKRAELSEVELKFDPWDDTCAVVHEELARLPERLRNVAVLCYIEGNSYQEAARQLGCPVLTVKSRLVESRRRLRRRLDRRGLAPASAVLATAFSSEASATTAVLPAALAESIVTTATQFAANPSFAAGVVPAHIASLTQGVLLAMYWTKLKLAATVCLVGVVASGALVSAQVFDKPATAINSRTGVRPVVTQAPATLPLGAEPSHDRLEALERKLDRLIQVLEAGQPHNVPPPVAAAAVVPEITGSGVARFAADSAEYTAVLPPSINVDPTQMRAPAVSAPAAVPPPPGASDGTLQDRMSKVEQRLGRLEQRLRQLEQRAASRIEGQAPLYRIDSPSIPSQNKNPADNTPSPANNPTQPGSTPTPVRNNQN